MSSYNPRPDLESLVKIKRAVASMDFAILLARVPWDFFVTLTFAGCVPREKIAYGLAWRWLRDVAEFHGVPYERLLIALRGEFGEKNGRFHFHCLVGGTTTRNYDVSAAVLKGQWWRLTRQSDNDIRRYDSSLAGADYVTKALGAKNSYELGKYSSADGVTLSDSVYRFIACRDFYGKTLRPAQLKKREGGENVGALGGLGIRAEITPNPVPFTLRLPSKMGQQRAGLA